MPYGTPVDVYSFAVTLLEIGVRAFPDADPESDQKVGTWVKLQFMRTGGRGAVVRGP